MRLFVCAVFSVSLLLPTAAGAQAPVTLTVKRLTADVAAPFEAPAPGSKTTAPAGAGEKSLLGGARFGLPNEPTEGKVRRAFEIARISDWPDTKIEAETLCAAVAGQTLCVDVPVTYTRKTTLQVFGEIELPTAPGKRTEAALRECMLSLDDELLIGAIRLPDASLTAIKATVAGCLDKEAVDLAAAAPSESTLTRIIQFLARRRAEPAESPIVGQDISVGLSSTKGAGEWQRAK